MSGKPDILWIVTTQWRAQARGRAGDLNARTPGLDALARSACEYRQAVTPHPFGPPARAALLTGVLSPANGVRDYFDPLPRAARTIAHELNERDYETAWFGKWHLSARDPRAPLVGEAHARAIVPEWARGGFQFWEGFESGFLARDPWLHGTGLEKPIRFPGRQDEVLIGRFERWRQTPRRGPRFAVLSLEPPHPPYGGLALADAREAREASAATVQLAGNVPAEAATRAGRELAGYYADIAALDQSLAPWIDALRRDWIVVLTSVHGDMHGGHGLFRKGWPHEESVRVPLLVWHPATGRGRIDDGPVSLVDLPSMTLAWAEGKAWSCHREYAAISMPAVVPLPDQCDRIWRGWRTPDWKVVFAPDDVPWLVFDLRRDPLERHNLAGDPAVSQAVARARRSGLENGVT